MSRQVDIKAIVSHVVKGDGTDRCRICMGDTTEGQVFLGDTVMMDGNKPVTLSELLKIITGVEVPEDDILPETLCRKCIQEAMTAVHFKHLCDKSRNHWQEITDFLSQAKNPSPDDKTYFLFCKGKKFIKDQISKAKTKDDALKKLNSKFEVSLFNSKCTTIGKMRKSNIIPCSCPDCGKEFKSVHTLNDHLMNSMRVVCLLCEFVVHKQDLPQHMMQKHDVIPIYCSICYSVFSDENEYKRHYEIQHNLTKVCCIFCRAGFNSERALSTHMAAHVVMYCKVCSASFSNRKCFKHHQKECKSINNKLLMPELLFTCDYCGIEYNRKPSLRVHILHKHLNVLPYVCQTCGKRTSTLGHLTSHLKVHKTDRMTFQCHCGAKMRTELGYRMHLRIHSGEKPYQCKMCDERFLSASRRLDHVKRRHKNKHEMPHACQMCTARFIRPWELRKHYNLTHKIVDQIHIKRKEETVRRSKTKQ